MLRTIAECDKALKLIDMERAHILKVREYLKENGPILTTRVRLKLSWDATIQIIKTNPGISGKQVVEVLLNEGFELTGRQGQSLLSRLSQAGEIENRGKHGLGARWYLKESK